VFHNRYGAILISDIRVCSLFIVGQHPNSKEVLRVIMICNNVISVAKVGLSFYSFFIFIFLIYFIWELGLGISMMLYITCYKLSPVTIMITLSHGHILWWKIVGDSGRNDSIQGVIHILFLKQIHDHLG